MQKYNINKRRIYSNINRTNKWMGIIDYKTLWVIGIYASVIIFILSKVNIEFQIKLYIFAVFSIPIFAMFICSDINQDSIFDMFKVIVRYIIKKAIYTKGYIGKNTRKNMVYKNLNRIL